MNLITHKPRPVLSFRNLATPRITGAQDHDLPILAQEDNPHVILDWEGLIARGVEPALILGAERRWRGQRQPDCALPSNLYIGTAGWSLPRAEQHRFAPGASHLERYAGAFRAVEINSTFHRPHRESTFARWAGSVPHGFRFSVKVPRTITHDNRLAGVRTLVDEFLAALEPLGSRVGCLLVQLPPSLELDRRVARNFFAHLRDRFAKGIAVEPRHASWFTPECDALLEGKQVARVAADPPRAPNGAEPGGWLGLAYFRLHGFPRVYYSSYDEAFLDALANRLRALRRQRIPAWCIFDNTTLGAGTANALSILERLS